MERSAVSSDEPSAGILNQNDYNSSVRRSPGFSLVEVLAGLLILSLVITTSLAVFYHRERTLIRAEETMLAWQVLANEAELVRRIPYAHLGALNGLPFRSDLELIAGFDGVTTRIDVAESRPMLKDVTLRLSWAGDRDASVTLVRSDTGGSNLW